MGGSNEQFKVFTQEFASKSAACNLVIAHADAHALC